MEFIYPDLDWHTQISKANSTPPRCPYANVHRCSRYYSSLYLLGKAGIATEIEPDKVKELDKLWENSDLLPVVAEHDTGITSCDDKKSGFYNFCPEVSFDIFGLFAISLHRYADEIDKDVAHDKLGEIGYPKDWRWEWAHVEPLHYLKCPVYSQLISKPVRVSEGSSPEEANSEMIEVKPEFMGISLNIKVLITRLANWWLSKQKN